MVSIVFKSTTSAVITRFTTAAILLLALAACYVDGDPIKDKVIAFKPIVLAAIGVDQGVDISWNAVSGATSYTVYYHTASFNQTSDSGVESKTGITATNTSITGLTNGTKYYLRVESINANNGDKGLSVEITATANLQAPTKLQATGGDKIVDISWSAVTGATSYKVYYSEASFDSITDSGVTSIIGITTTNASITGLTAGTKYYLRVEVINADGDKKLSKVVTATTKAAATANLQPPTNLQATGGDRIVDISWSAVTGATSYTVYYHTVGFDKITDSGVKSKTGITTTNTSIAGLINDTTYYFRLIASNASVSSALSQIQSATTKASVPAELQPPTNLQATGGDRIVDISWSAVTGATSYTVYYSEASFDSITDSGVKSKTGITTTNTSIAGLINDTTYYFRLIASNASVSSALSQIQSATTKASANNLQAPINLIATGGDRIVDISWSAVAGAASYKVYYSTTSFSSAIESGVQSKNSVTTTSTIITGLLNGTKYFIRLVASNSKGDSGLSNQVSAITKLPAPINLQATGGDKIIDISWDAVADATSYNVYYSKASFDNITDGGVTSIIGIATTNTIITGLTNGTTYYLRVTAINAYGESNISEQVSATSTKLYAPQPSAAASIISPAAVDLSWDAVVGVTDYKIYYAKDSLDYLNGGYKNYALVGGKVEVTTATSATIGDLSADTTYYFVVVANYKGGEAAAPEVSAKTSYIAELAMGREYGCVRLNTGRIKCWGRNYWGQLGLGDTRDRKTATSVSGIRAKQLSAGGEHSCAIDLSDRLYCWGSNGNSGGDRLRRPTLVTQAKLAKVSLVTAGVDSTCAVANGNNYCWGYQDDGALGNGASSGSTSIAQKINNITSDVRQFALGVHSGCAIDASDDLWCWGGNVNGQVGDGSSKLRQTSPVKPKLQGRSTATVLAGIHAHYCVVDNANKTQCWGNNYSGQLGINSKTNSNSPQYVLASDSTSDHLNNVSKIATGGWHSCALIAGGKVHCWGESDDGSIGDTTTDRLVANTDMKGINDAIDIAAGLYHTCVLLADKARVKCWGANHYGQLGNGTTIYSSMPVEVQGL